ncbi:MAG TPA: heparan-alpha-glucosaminide N-acetyltransferase domain-containing protein [Puia sp.]|nr:heparan-alpha-glucosaminide N-acetyltransferase domain-containing protein [Puia sp.]
MTNTAIPLGKVPASTLPRIQSVDLLRGLIIVLMAIDHVRVYSGIPAGAPSPGIFFTRWVTNFSAPGFAFFAGTSAFLYFLKTGDRSGLSRFLLSRGFLLVLLELTVIRFFWMFNFDYAHFILAGVIWMLGWCMVILSAFVRLKPRTVGIIGLAIIFGQQIFHYVPKIFPASMRASVGWIWEFLYPSGLDGMPGISILYVLIPWIGVMMAGYGFGQLLISKRENLKKICFWIGISSIITFVIAGSLIIILGSPYEGKMPFLFRLLAQQKYPPSQVFLLMTLGPLILLVPWAEKAKGWFADTLKIFGRVPMFFYLLHILLIHVSALAVNLIISGNAHQDWYSTAPFVEISEDQRWSLPQLYLVYAIDMVILYFACHWYAGYKSRHPEKKWLKYF